MADKSKKELRETALQKRDAILEHIKGEKDKAIMRKTLNLPEFKNAKTIFFYASFRSEVNTIEMIKESLLIGKKIILPKVDKKNSLLRLYEINDLKELSAGYMKIMEPLVPENRSRDLNDIDLVIVPGAAFDIHGNRLGYGAGYYDKLLAKMKRKIPIVAPAYEEQVIEEIPAEAHDIKADMIVTDKRVIRCI